MMKLKQFIVRMAVGADLVPNGGGELPTAAF
jgi:hypothetical protein